MDAGCVCVYMKDLTILTNTSSENKALRLKSYTNSHSANKITKKALNVYKRTNIPHTWNSISP